MLSATTASKAPQAILPSSDFYKQTRTKPHKARITNPSHQIHPQRDATSHPHPVAHLLAMKSCSD